MEETLPSTSGSSGSTSRYSSGYWSGSSSGSDQGGSSNKPEHIMHHEHHCVLRTSHVKKRELHNVKRNPSCPPVYEVSSDPPPKTQGTAEDSPESEKEKERKKGPEADDGGKAKKKTGAPPSTGSPAKGKTPARPPAAGIGQTVMDRLKGPRAGTLRFPVKSASWAVVAVLAPFAHDALAAVQSVPYFGAPFRWFDNMMTTFQNWIAGPRDANGVTERQSRLYCFLGNLMTPQRLRRKEDDYHCDRIAKKAKEVEEAEKKQALEKIMGGINKQIEDCEGLLETAPNVADAHENKTRENCESLLKYARAVSVLSDEGMDGNVTGACIACLMDWQTGSQCVCANSVVQASIMSAANETFNDDLWKKLNDRQVAFRVRRTRPVVLYGPKDALLWWIATKMYFNVIWDKDEAVIKGWPNPNYPWPMRTLLPVADDGSRFFINPPLRHTNVNEYYKDYHND